VTQLTADSLTGYSIEKHIGSGGMSDVYQAVQKRLGRTVALKVRRPNRVEYDAKLRERFVQSVRLHSSMNHPNIVRVIDLLHEGGRDVAVLELLSGPTLEQTQKKKGSLPLLDVLHVGLDISRALEHIHARGVVHRDIKPSNMMFSDTGASAIVKLMDFGVAKGSAHDSDLTVKGANIGTLWYMSPGQLAGKTPSPAWDLFALGVSLYELWIGQLPLQDRSQSAVFRRHLDGESIPEWSQKYRTVSVELCDILQAMLEIDPNKRLKDLAVFTQLIRALRNTHASNSDAHTGQSTITSSVLNQNLAGLAEHASLRLKRLMNHQAPTQEITVSVDRRGFESESFVADLDDTILTDSMSDE
jgi:serine/threonine-protein kinase